MRLSIVQRHKSRGIKTWYLRTFDEKTGAISYKSLDTTKKYEAAAALSQAQAERYAPPSEKEKEAAVIIDPETAAARYIAASTLANESENTLINKKSVMRRYIDFCQSEDLKDATELTAEQAGRFIQEITGGKASTTGKRIRQFRAFYSWLFDSVEIDRVNPFKRIRAPREEKAIRAFWTVEQVEKIIESEQDKERRLFYSFQAWAGLRFTEAASLTWDNVKNGPDKYSITILNGKGGKSASLPMGPRMRAAIDEYLGGAEKPEFGLIFNNILRNRPENLLLKKLVEEIGIVAPGPVHCHRFRHSFASNLLRAGAGLVETSKLMRHESVNITLKYYAHCLPDDLDKALKLL